MVAKIRVVRYNTVDTRTSSLASKFDFVWIRIKIWGVREKYVILEDINWIFGTDVFK